MERKLSSLKNLGVALSRKLGEVGIHSESDLRRIGPSEAFRLMEKHEGKRLPVCYYLFSLAGALEGRHWNDVDESHKHALLRAVGRNVKRKSEGKQRSNH